MLESSHKTERLEFLTYFKEKKSTKKVIYDDLVNKFNQGLGFK